MTTKLIDITKEYTCNGKPVKWLQCVMCNSTGAKVTYPIKGSICITPTRYKYAIWTLTGIADVLNPESDHNLKERK